MKKIKLFLALFLFGAIVFAQSPAKHFKNGKAYYRSAAYKHAIISLSSAIKAKQDNDKALNLRGLCYEAIGDYKNAALDFQKALVFEEKEAEYHSNLGRAYFYLEEYEKAIASLKIALDRDKKIMPAYAYKLKAHMALSQFEAASRVGQEAVAKEKSAATYYNFGIALDSLSKFEEAAYCFSKARSFEPTMVEAHIGLAYSNMKLGDLPAAIKASDKSLKIEPKNIHALLVRSSIEKANHSPQKAINVISKIIAIQPKEKEYYVIRGKIYQELVQNQNAIADFTKALSLKKDDYQVYYLRAKSYEMMTDYKSAIRDYEAIRTLAPYDGKASKLYDEAKARLFELNREKNIPHITISSPEMQHGNQLFLPKGTLLYTIKGIANDQSKLTSIKVNEKNAVFNKDTLNPVFTVELNIQDNKNLTVEATDVYQNLASNKYNIVESEVDTPIINLLVPYASDDGTVYLDDDAPTVYLEGEIEDESLIKSIQIEGATASYVLDKVNPRFSATIEVKNKKDFTVVVEDEYGNKSSKRFSIDRKNAALLADNPMGKTWVVFIENSNYNSFASLDGPTKDVVMMKSAFTKYKIHNMVHKKNMTKAELERFFAIELRDLVKNNRVNSLLVWYAGHGKFINESGYWVPIDAERDDEFSYFNINNLKAGMQSYSKFITHTLVVTDACESGPSFYQAMRSTKQKRSCNDWQATKFKSSQVFSSAGYELASDNSQFTKTFANTLNSNPNSCVPIETVVNKVSDAVTSSSNNQKPKFGKITGLEDENGTFFFIKK